MYCDISRCIYHIYIWSESTKMFCFASMATRKVFPTYMTEICIRRDKHSPHCDSNILTLDKNLTEMSPWFKSKFLLTV